MDNQPRLPVPPPYISSASVPYVVGSCIQLEGKVMSDTRIRVDEVHTYVLEVTVFGDSKPTTDALVAAAKGKYPSLTLAPIAKSYIDKTFKKWHANSQCLYRLELAK